MVRVRHLHGWVITCENRVTMPPTRVIVADDDGVLLDRGWFPPEGTAVGMSAHSQRHERAEWLQVEGLLPRLEVLAPRSLRTVKDAALGYPQGACGDDHTDHGACIEHGQSVCEIPRGWRSGCR